VEAVNASFESARPSIDRKTIFLDSLSTRREVSQWDRLSLLEKGRWAVNNSGLAARIVRGTARFAVGQGLIPQAQTEDSQWNKTAEQWFEDRFCSEAFAFDKAGVFDFYSAQTMLIESMITDGDIFFQLVKSGNDSPMVRFVTGDCIGGFSVSGNADWVDGVRLNADGRAIAYGYQAREKMLSGEAPMEISANEIFPIWRPHRAGAVRGVSWLGTAIARLQDLAEMDGSELAAAKLNSKIALTIESENVGKIGLGSLGTTTTAAGEEYKTDNLLPGAGSLHLKPGEKLQAHTFDRPNTNYPFFKDHLARECAYSVGVSPEIIWNLAGLGGTATRQALIDADVFFGGIRQIIEARFCAKFWKYAVWNGAKSGELPPLPANWWRCNWVGPQKLTVDNGRDGKLRKDNLEAGLLSPKRYFSEMGQDADQETEDIIRGAAWKKKRVAEIAKEEGIELTVQEVFPPPPGSQIVQKPEEKTEVKPVEKKGEDEEVKALLIQQNQMFMAMLQAMQAGNKAGDTIINLPESVGVALPAPVVNVAAPEVHIEQPVVNVAAPDVRINVAAADAPQINFSPRVEVAPQVVTVLPSPVNVTVPRQTVRAVRQENGDVLMVPEGGE